eukprot:279900-Chlamydomonas_euryale.AAC.1
MLDACSSVLSQPHTLPSQLWALKCTAENSCSCAGQCALHRGMQCGHREQQCVFEWIFPHHDFHTCDGQEELEEAAGRDAPFCRRRLDAHATWQRACIGHAQRTSSGAKQIRWWERGVVVGFVSWWEGGVVQHGAACGLVGEQSMRHSRWVGG